MSRSFSTERTRRSIYWSSVVLIKCVVQLRFTTMEAYIEFLSENIIYKARCWWLYEILQV